MTEPSHYNPIIAADPFDDYRAMQGGCPVSHSGPIDTPFFTLSDYAAIKAALTDPDGWSARYGTGPVFQKSIGFFADGKTHLEFRRLFAQRLALPRLAPLEPVIIAIAGELLDAMIAKGPAVDFHNDFALPLPMRVIAILLGVPGDDFPRLKALSNDLIATGFGTDSATYLKVYDDCCAFFEHYLLEREAMLQAAGITQPSPEHVGTVLPDDWISDALCQHFEGRNLTRAEQHVALMGLLVGGNETTTSLMTNLLWRLLEVPSRWAELKADPSLIPNAIEESLRFDSPVLGMFRTTLCPATVAGVDIPGKAKAMMAFGAGNRDPEVFADPHEFRLDRPRKEQLKHMAFSLGNHACMGAPLSRLEARIAFDLLVERLPQVRLNGETERNQGWNFWGRVKLPLLLGQE